MFLCPSKFFHPPLPLQRQIDGLPVLKRSLQRLVPSLDITKQRLLSPFSLPVFLSFLSSSHPLNFASSGHTIQELSFPSVKTLNFPSFYPLCSLHRFVVMLNNIINKGMVKHLCKSWCIKRNKKITSTENSYTVPNILYNRLLVDYLLLRTVDGISYLYCLRLDFWLIKKYLMIWNI